MSRYTGPTTRINRRFSQAIFAPTKAFERKPHLPGQHGPRLRRKLSDYAIGLNEKQKLRYMYGMTEKQFRLTFERAKSKRGVTGEIFLQMLECRLDNVVYRMGFGSTRAEARQIVSHRSIMVNGKVLNIPSYQVKPGDVVSVCEKAKGQLRVRAALELAGQRADVHWVDVDSTKMEGTFNMPPERQDLSQDINENLIVELYSK